MEKLKMFLVILFFLIIISILVLSVLSYLKIKKLQLGDCVGVPKFESNSVYTKILTIPLINKSINGTATFKNDNTFGLDFGNNNTFPNNKWTYDQDNCQINIVLDPNLQSLVTKYDCSIDNDVKIDKKGNLIVNGSILGLLPINVTLEKK